jgi:hypothetical protein
MHFVNDNFRRKTYIKIHLRVDDVAATVEKAVTGGALFKRFGELMIPPLAWLRTPLWD